MAFSIVFATAVPFFSQLQELLGSLARALGLPAAAAAGKRGEEGEEGGALSLIHI